MTTHQDMFDAAGIQVDTIMPSIRAPFPWFGGKSRVASLVWERFGDVRNYVEPFFGSGAVLLGRPGGFGGPETVNDLDGFLANFWRAVAHDPEATAHWADWPVNEADLHARQLWLVNQRETLTARLMGDPDYFDAKIAGYWVWGICCWIGSGWCSGVGPWVTADGMLTRGAGMGIKKQRPHLGSAGMGIHKRLPHLGNAGMGINKQTGDKDRHGFILDWFRDLQSRLRDVRVACGDWQRVCGASVTTKHPGITGVFLDPPYANTAGRCEHIYACDDLSVAHEVCEWAIANGDNPKIRIALCGYEGEHAMPDSWEVVEWKTKGGYGMLGEGNGRENQTRERIWFSPGCLSPLTPSRYGVS